MSSVNIDGRDYKRCMKCGEWTDFDDLMYIPPTRQYDKAEEDRLHDALSYEVDHKYDGHPTLHGVKRVVDDDAYRAYADFHAECFGLDVCAACAVLHESAYRASFLTIKIKE